MPPSKPPGPPRPGSVDGPAVRPLTSIVPSTFTSPVARMVTGVLVWLRLKVAVTPLGIFTVVKLNTPLAGSAVSTMHGVGLHVGLNAPSAPVLPLENAAPAAWGVSSSITPATRAAPIPIVDELKRLMSTSTPNSIFQCSDSGLATSAPHGLTVNPLLPVAASAEFPAPVCTTTTCDPSTAEPSLDTFADSCVPPAPATIFVAVMCVSGAPSTRKTSAVAPLKFVPLSVRPTMAPRAAEPGATLLITAALATLTGSACTTAPGSGPNATLTGAALAPPADSAPNSTLTGSATTLRAGGAASNWTLTGAALAPPGGNGPNMTLAAVRAYWF